MVRGRSLVTAMALATVAWLPAPTALAQAPATTPPQESKVEDEPLDMTSDIELTRAAIVHSPADVAPAGRRAPAPTAVPG